MSHHGINMMPSLLPLSPTGRLGKKRRTRRKKGVDQAHAIGTPLSLDELFAVSEAEDDEDTETFDDMDSGRLVLSAFSGGTMRTILQGAGRTIRMVGATGIEPVTPTV